MRSYNYVVDPSVRRAQSEGAANLLRGSIVVFDEAHNLEASCVRPPRATAHAHRACAEHARACVCLRTYYVRSCLSACVWVCVSVSVMGRWPTRTPPPFMLPAASTLRRSTSRRK